MAIATAMLLGGGSAYGDAFRTRVLQSPPADASMWFSREQISYFLDVALGSEYGHSSSFVRRWEDDVRIRINFPASERVDAQTQQDVRHMVEHVVADLNQLIAESFSATYGALQSELNDAHRPIQIDIVDAPDAVANVEFYFVRAENFPIYDSNTQPGQVGFVWTWWHQDAIRRSRILVASNNLTPAERDHVIREELTQALGILRDSWEYPSSIFYQGWTTPTEYDPIDEAVIQMLYHPKIRPGMTAADVEATLSNL